MTTYVISPCEVCGAHPTIISVREHDFTGIRVRCDPCTIARLTMGIGLEPCYGQKHEVQSETAAGARKAWDDAQQFNMRAYSAFDHVPWGLDFDCE